MSEAHVTQAQTQKRACSSQPDSTRKKKKPRVRTKKATDGVTNTSASTNTAASTSETSGGKNGTNAKFCQRKVLNKAEKTNVICQVKTLQNATLSMLAMMGVRNQLPLSSKDLKVFCDSASKSEAIDTDQSVVIMVAKVTIDTDL